MALVSLDELKHQLAELVAMERAIQQKTDKRGEGWKVYLKARELIQTLAGPVAKDEPETAAFVAKATPLLEQRMKAMEEANAFNPITVEVHERSELDLFLLKKKLADEDHKVQLEAVSAAGELNWEDALDTLVEMLQGEPHPFVLSKLTKVVGQIGGKKVLDVLAPFLEHEDDRVRANTVEGIDCIPGEEKFVLLMPMLEDASPRVRANALKAIQALGGENFASLMKRMIRNPDENHRRSALYVLASLKTTFGHECLVVMLEDNHPDIRGRAIELLAARKDWPAIESLVDFMGSECGEKTREKVHEALRGLRASAPPEVVERLDAYFQQKVSALEDLRGDDPGPPAEDDVLGRLALLSKPMEKPKEGPKAYSRGATSSSDHSKPPGQNKDVDLKKAMARMGAVLSSLQPRERREAEKMIRSGKVLNEQQLKTAINRLRNKRR